MGVCFCRVGASLCMACAACALSLEVARRRISLCSQHNKNESCSSRSHSFFYRRRNTHHHHLHEIAHVNLGNAGGRTSGRRYPADMPDRVESSRARIDLDFNCMSQNGQHAVHATESPGPASWTPSCTCAALVSMHPNLRHGLHCWKTHQ